MTEAVLLLVIQIERNELRSLFEFVHERLECLVASLLEAHIVFEADGDQVVDLALEDQHFLSHLDRLVLQGLRKHDFLALLLDEWVHLVDDVFERHVHAIENFIDEFELIFAPAIEHLFTTLVHFRDFFGKVFDGFGEHNFLDFWLGTCLQEGVGVVLLLPEVLMDLGHVLIAGHGAAPLARVLLEKLGCRGVEVSLEFVVVHAEASLADPVELVAVLHLLDVDFLLVANVDELHDGLLNQALVHHLALPVFFDLNQNCASETIEVLAEDLVTVHAECGLSERLVALVLEMEAVEVLHDLADGISEQREFTPLVNVLNQKRVCVADSQLQRLFDHNQHFVDLLLVHLVKVL